MPYDKETRDALQAYDDKKYTPAQLQIYAKAKKFVAQSWLKLLPETGNKRSMRNFSKNYPPSCLKEGDAAYIADMVAQIMGDEERFKASIDKFFSDLQEPLEAGFKACAKARWQPTKMPLKVPLISFLPPKAQKNPIWNCETNSWLSCLGMTARISRL